MTQKHFIVLMLITIVLLMLVTMLFRTTNTDSYMDNPIKTEDLGNQLANIVCGDFEGTKLCGTTEDGISILLKCSKGKAEIHQYKAVQSVLIGNPDNVSD